VFLWLGPLLCLLAVGVASVLRPAAGTRADLVAARAVIGAGVLVSVAVLAFVWVLQRRPVTGPPDLAAAQVAVRSRSARTLATGGAVFGLQALSANDMLGLRLPDAAALPILVAWFAFPVAALVVGTYGSTVAEAVQDDNEEALSRR
jgi:hypothetical protein